MMEETLARRVSHDLSPLQGLRVLAWESADDVLGEVALRLGET